MALASATKGLVVIWLAVAATPAVEQATVIKVPVPAAVAGQLQVRTLLRAEPTPQLAQLPHSDQGVGATSVNKKDQIGYKVRKMKKIE